MASLSDRNLQWILLITAVVGLAVRAQTAAAWPLQNDEAVHLYRSWILATEGTYQYTPWTHGPFLYYFSSLVLPSANWSFLAGRFIISLFWLPSLIGLYWLRDKIGGLTVAAAGILLSLHHYVVWMSTYFRNDIILISILLTWLGGAALYLKNPTVTKALALGALGALSIAVKETSFVIAFVLVWTLIGWYLWVHGPTLTAARDYWQDYGTPAVWGIPAAGTTVILFFFSGVPVTVQGVLTAPLEAIRGPLFWLQPKTIIRARRGVWWYFTLLARSPLILLSGGIGGLLALRSRRLILVGFTAIFTSFFVLHSFVTKQPRRFILYMIVPLCLLAGYALELAVQRIKLTQQHTATAVIGGALLVTVLAGVGAPAILAPVESPNTLYPQWGLDEDQKEALHTAASFSKKTDCTIHVVDGSVNYQVSKWYLREPNFTHGKTDLNVSIEKTPYVIVSDEEPNVSYPSQSVAVGGFMINWPQQNCSSVSESNSTGKLMVRSAVSRRQPRLAASTRRGA